MVLRSDAETVFCAWPSSWFDQLHRHLRAGRLAAQLIAVPVAPRRDPWEDLVQSIDGVVFAADPATLAFTFVSDGAVRILGHQASRWLEPGFFADHLHPDDRDRTFAACRAATDAGKDHELSYRMRAADGRWVWLHDSTRVVRDRDGRTVLRGVLLDISALKTVEALQQEQTRLIAMIAEAQPLPHILDSLLRGVEALDPEISASILLLDDDGKHLRHGAAPSLPEAYCRLVDGFAIGPGQACCGTAAWRREMVIVEDVLTDPLWAPFREVVAPFGLRSCWSTPFFDSDGRVLGTFAIYNRQPARPRPEHLQWIAAAAHTAAICVSRTRVLQALRDEQQQTADLIENATEGVVTIDDRGVVMRWNRQAELIFDITREQTVGKPLDVALVPIADRAAHSSALQTALATGQLAAGGRPLERTALRQDGSEVHLEIALTRTWSGGRAWFTAFLRDLTERHRAEQTRQSLERQLQIAQRMEALGTLAGGVAHEFNNLLAVILGNAELAAAAPASDSNAQRHLQEIVKAATRATSLTRQILQFGRRQIAQRQPVSLPTIVNDSITMLRATLPARIAVSAEYALDTPTVLADPTEIHQVVLNLCTNSWQAIGERAGRITVTLRSAQIEHEDAALLPGASAGRHAVMEVRDDGCGMDAQTRERMFEPFFTTKATGTGLGLSVVHGIVSSHGGVLTVDTTPGAGTTIRIWLPAVEETPQPTVREPLPACRGRGERILLLDDEPTLLQVLRRSLTRLGFAPTAFTRADEAIAALQANPAAFDAVLTDHNMPVMSGLEFAAATRTIRRDLPIVLASGLVTEATQATAASLGIRQFVAKPNTMHDLGAALRAALDTPPAD